MTLALSVGVSLSLTIDDLLPLGLLLAQLALGALVCLLPPVGRVLLQLHAAGIQLLLLRGGARGWANRSRLGRGQTSVGTAGTEKKRGKAGLDTLVPSMDNSAYRAVITRCNHRRLIVPLFS